MDRDHYARRLSSQLRAWASTPKYQRSTCYRVSRCWLKRSRRDFFHRKFLKPGRYSPPVSPTNNKPAVAGCIIKTNLLLLAATRRGETEHA